MKQGRQQAVESAAAFEVASAGFVAGGKETWWLASDPLVEEVDAVDSFVVVEPEVPVPEVEELGLGERQLEQKELELAVEEPELDLEQ